jgi:hypothetical protein
MIRSPSIARLLGLTAVGVAIAASIGGCGSNAAEGANRSPGAPEDRPLAAFQVDLLDLAFETATAIPAQPHIKDRCKTQEAVVAACLELDQPVRALAYLERIDDWRRGSAHADLAFYCARRDFPDQARQHLEFAGQIAATAADWRRDRIKVKIARAFVALGEDRQAERWALGVADSEAGKLNDARAMMGDDDDFEAQLAAVDVSIATGNLLRNALATCLRLFDRHFDDAARRVRIERKLRASWAPLPILPRLQLLMELSESALERADRAKALELVNEAHLLMNHFEWPLENRLELSGQLARLRYRAGDASGARTEVDEALALYETQGGLIVDIWRAGALRPLAEACQAMGDRNGALSVYRLAVEEGVRNPNSRPRAEDLAATCVSMASNAVEPDAGLWARIRAIRAGLSQPW